VPIGLDLANFGPGDLLDLYWLTGLRVIDRVAVKLGELQTLEIKDALWTEVGDDQPVDGDEAKDLEPRISMIGKRLNKTGEKNAHHC
jgi:hypothetical protein